MYNYGVYSRGGSVVGTAGSECFVRAGAVVCSLWLVAPEVLGRVAVVYDGGVSVRSSVLSEKISTASNS